MLEYELNLAKKAALEAGKLLLNKGFCKVNSEEGKDLKLSSDVSSEQLIIDILKESGYSILSEECGLVKNNKDDYLWIIDPLDGSVNYWRGLEELSCVSIALWHETDPILGVVYRFEEDQLYCGVSGEGATKNGNPIQTSHIELVSQAILSTGFPVKRNYSQESLNHFIRQVQNFKKIRMLGTAATMGTLVAEGCFDVYIEEEIMFWDIAASAAIVKAAGGCVEIEMLNDNRCICKLFANDKLKGNYYANCV